MKFQLPDNLQTDIPIMRISCSSDLPHLEAGLMAALRRAYAAPPSAANDAFGDLLAKLP